MPARLHRGNGLFRVDMIGPADIDDVNASILEDFVEAVVKRTAAGRTCLRGVERYRDGDC